MPAASTRSSAGRRWLLRGSFAVAILVAVELLSGLALRVAAGQWLSWGRLATERAAVVAEVRDEAEGAHDESLDDFRRQLPRRHRDEQVLHPFLGFVLDPTRHPAARRPGANPQSGELGFPFNSEPLIQPPAAGPNDDRLVVALFGGSVANMLANAGRPALVEALAALPRFRGRRPVVLSVANPGYKQPQQLIALNYLLSLGAHFDLVLNLDGFNEVALPPVELLPRGANPHFPQNWPLRVGDLGPAHRALLGERAFLRRRRAGRAALFSRFPLSRSFTAGLLWKVLDGRMQRRITALEGDLAHPAAELTFEQRGPRRELLSPAPAAQDLAEVWRRGSALMADLCAARGIEYHHFLQPNQYDDGAKPLSAEERATAWRADHPYRAGVAAGYPLLRQAGTRLQADGVAFHDLSDLFATVEETLYLDDCCHLNRRGNELLASAVAAAVRGGAVPEE